MKLLILRILRFFLESSFLFLMKNYTSLHSRKNILPVCQFFHKLFPEFFTFSSTDLACQILFTCLSPIHTSYWNILVSYLCFLPYLYPSIACLTFLKYFVSVAYNLPLSLLVWPSPFSPTILVNTLICELRSLFSWLPFL